MRPKHRNRRIILILVCGAILATGIGLLLSALKQNTQFFYNPSEILADGFAPQSEDIRIGGLVLEGSIVKGDGLETSFRVADFPEDEAHIVDKNLFITVTYEGILPDLFREGQGVVITGVMSGPSSFIASDVLAKHDENYQPKK